VADAGAAELMQAIGIILMLTLTLTAIMPATPATVAIPASVPAHPAPVPGTETRVPSGTASPTVAQADSPSVPITFARSGQPVRAELTMVSRPVEAVVLRAFGRMWSPPAPVSTHPAGLGWEAQLAVPQVRVPTVFDIVTAGPAGTPPIVLGQIVAYPPGDAKWDRDIQLVCCGSPRWFDQWTHAVGLAVSQVGSPADVDTMVGRGKQPYRTLLILGRSTAGAGPGQVLPRRSPRPCNVLVLEAEWLGPTAGPVDVSAAQAEGGLAGLAKERWPMPLRFPTHQGYSTVLANRWCWLAGGEVPLVEQLQPPAPAGRSPALGALVVSYLPWAQQLGRSEPADRLLLELLKSAAMANAAELGGSLAWALPGEEAPRGDRVLAAAAWAADPVDATVLVLDLRADRFADPPPHKPPPQAGKMLLVLGDDPRLQDLSWLGIDHAKMTVAVPGVTWLSDDQLPLPPGGELRLMQTLTQLGVPFTSKQGSKP